MKNEVRVLVVSAGFAAPGKELRPVEVVGTIVEYVVGEIRLEANAGRGCRFVFSWPRTVHEVVS